MDIVTEATIAATRATVWNIITDAELYPQWNPYIRELHGALTAGSPIVFRFALFAHVTLPARAQVLVVSAESELRWAGHLLADWFFRAEHYHLLEPIAERSLRFHHGERFSGLAAMLLAPLIRAWAPGRYRAANLALKQRAERA
jgi:hypothetical protein